MAVETPPDQLTGLPPLIPRDVLFGNPERTQARLSPDGRQLAYIAPVNGILNLFAGPADGSPGRQVTEESVRSIRGYTWAANSRHLLYVQDTGGDENWHVYSVDLQTGEIADRTPFEGVMAQIQDIERSHPDEVLLALNNDNPQLHDVHRLDLRTGELALVEKNPGFIAYGADHDLKVRFAVAMNPDGSVDLLVRDGGEGEFRLLLHVPFEDTGSLLGGELGGGFNADGTKLVIPHPVGANASRLVRIDLASGTSEVLFEDPDYDVSIARLNPVTYEPDLVAVLRDRLEWYALDPSLERDLTTLRALHDGDFNILSRSHDDRRWMVAFTSDRGPTCYYLYDRDAGTATLLFKDRPELERYTLAAKEPFSFKARDGLTVHGYLTFPPGLERTNLKTALLVHGGPWARDVWGFDPLPQLYANRGYLCVQVNYRGSTGYGKAFVKAADREWAGKMHTDLIDAVDHLAGLGHIDRSKVAITGGSYGGYATLVGVTFTPDVFCCGVDIVGPSNLNTLIRSVPEYWKPTLAIWTQRVGDPNTEEDFLWSRSPLSRVDQIRVPLLIVQGENDPRVKKQESDQIVEAMKERGIPHEYVVVQDEGHGFANAENCIMFAILVLRFLAQHVGGRSQEN